MCGRSYYGLKIVGMLAPINTNIEIAGIMMPNDQNLVGKSDGINTVAKPQKP